MSYLSLNDDAGTHTYMRVTSGIATSAFKNVSMPFGFGLGGLVAQTATPYWIEDYPNDPRFDHRPDLDSAVAG